MTWEKAKEIIKVRITPGTKLNDTRRVVEKSPTTVNEDFVVCLGKKFNEIKVSWRMLEVAYDALSSPEGYYRGVLFPEFAQKVNRKGCYVHSIGQILVQSGIAVKVDEHHYHFRQDKTMK